MSSMFGYRSAVSCLKVNWCSALECRAQGERKYYHHMDPPLIVSSPEAMYDLNLYQVPDIFIELLPTYILLG